MILGLGQEIDKMTLEHLTAWESKKVLKKNSNYVRGTYEPTWKDSQGQKLGEFEKQNK